mgnify:CR=1 FL=1
MPIEQSGSISPGHLVKWVTEGGVGDAGPAAGLPVLARLLSADFNSIADQPIQIPNDISAFQLTGIIITNASLSMSVAAGGFYPAVGKGGTAIVAASQGYSALTTANALLLATLTGAAASTRFSSANLTLIDGYLTLYLSLSTAQGVNATADCYILGTDLSA